MSLPTSLLSLLIIVLIAVAIIIFVPKNRVLILIIFGVIVGVLYFSGRLSSLSLELPANRESQAQSSSTAWTPPSGNSEGPDAPGDAQPEITPTPESTYRPLPPNLTCLIKNSFGPSVTQWCSQVMAYSYRYNVDPNLVAAVITQESNGRQWQDAVAKTPLISSSGAIGVMQIIPRDNTTGKKWFAQNGEYEGERFSNCKDGENGGQESTFNDHCRPYYEDLVNNPDLVIQYGVWLLRQYLDQSNGSVRDALMVYGPLKNGDVYADTIINNYKSQVGQDPLNHFPDDQINLSTSTTKYQGQIYLIGDSLTEGMVGQIEPLFASKGLSLTVNSQNGRHVTETVNLVGSMGIPNHSLVIVALGTNDGPDPASFKTNVDDALTRLINNQVIWLTIDRPGFDNLNTILLNQETADYPNLTIADWAAFRRNSPQWLGIDQVHLTPEGYQARAEFILQEVQKLLSKKG